MKLFVLALLIGAASAACPNGCSGHGSCQLGEICDCQPRWIGADCGSRECPYGLSWTTSAETGTAPGGATYDSISSYFQPYANDAAYMGEGGRHEYTECSSKGTCDRSSGECQCFDGYAGKGCRKMKCPNDCSGNGMCMTNFEINAEYNDVSPDSQKWDWNKATQCRCDAGFHGLDCSLRTCPRGDDPLTNCNTNTEISDIQQLTWTATTADAKNGWFTLTYTDAMGANYTTRPIFTYGDPSQHFTDNGDSAVDLGIKTARDMEEALEGLPNFAIPNVTVSYDPNGNTDSTRQAYDVTFLDAANAGSQVLLQCSHTGDSSYNHAASSPRFAAPEVAWDTNSGGRVCTAAHVALDGQHYPADQGYTLKEAVTCSNRGDCDTSSGVCECWEGFTGEACSEQTVFF